ncbi:hypothetical protein ANTPLA_LOCUS7709 [Anthophora plagiata]
MTVYILLQHRAYTRYYRRDRRGNTKPLYPWGHSEQRSAKTQHRVGARHITGVKIPWGSRGRHIVGANEQHTRIPRIRVNGFNECIRLRWYDKWRSDRIPGQCIRI